MTRHNRDDDTTGRARSDALDERAQRRAFLADLYEKWRPVGVQERRLDFESRLVHAIHRVIGTDGTMVPPALGLAMLTVGFGLLAAAESISSDPFPPIAPLWVGPVLVTSLVLTVIEFYRSGKYIHSRHFALRAGLPLAVSAGLMALLTNPATAADVWGRIAVALMSVAMAGMSAAALRTSARWFHRFGTLLALASVLLALSLGAWTGIYASGSAWLWAFGASMIALGSARLALGMWHAHPTLID